VRLALALVLIGCGRIAFDQTTDARGEQQSPDATDVMTDPLNCGTIGHSCLGGACNAGVCEPMTVVAGLGGDVYRMVVDASNVYWTEYMQNTVLSCPLTGCGTSPTTLATDQLDCRGIAVDATTLYWTNYNGGSIEDVMSCAIGGCGGAPTPVATDQLGPLDVALNATTVFWTDYNASSVLGCALGDCASPTTFASNELSATGIAADADDVYWSDNTGVGTIWSCSIADACGGGPTQLATDMVHPFRLALDATNVYWQDDTRVMEAAKDGSSVTTLIDDASGIGAGDSDIVIDDTYVYWESQGALQSCAIAGCNDTPTTLVASGVAVIAVDATAIYWSDGTTITKRAK
jgi:hypothetical protein